MDRSHAMRSQQISPVPTIAPGLAVAGVARQDLGLFVQDVWSITRAIDVTGGARYDALSAFKDEFSYRAALTATTGSWYGKLFYGTAFRVPSYREYLDATSCNFSLRPEHLHTV